MLLPALSRRAEASGFLGFAALAAAPVQALGGVIRWGRWYQAAPPLDAHASAPQDQQQAGKAGMNLPTQSAPTWLIRA
jgi:hypothetical protein